MHASDNDASFLPFAPVSPITLAPIERAVIAAAITLGEFPLVLMAINSLLSVQCFNLSGKNRSKL